MKPTLAGVFADARVLWRRERALLLPLAGVFFFVPMLGIVLLLAGSGFPGDLPPEQLRAAILAFFEANLPALLAFNLALAFGTFAALNLFLQGDGRTLGEILAITLRRLLPFLAIDIVVGFLWNTGFSLFLLPGLYIFARTWLIAPAFAAAPERGIGAAIRSGWRQSAGLNGLLALAAAAAAFSASLVAILASTFVLALLTAAFGDSVPVAAAGYVMIAAAGALAWTALSVLRVALYRLTVPRQGI